MRKLVTVIHPDLVQDLREQENITLLYPLKSFCIGYDYEFSIEEIDDFVLVNRILDDVELDQLQDVLRNASIKGIVFDDLGILEIVKDMDIVKILLLDHIATNVKSINYYLDYVDSVVVSSDLAKEEIEYIVRYAKKAVVLTVFELKKLMYSRRTLLSNYALYHGIENEKEMISTIRDLSFVIKENDFGTCFYAKKYYNGLCLTTLTPVYFYWYNLIGMSVLEAHDLILKDIVNVVCEEGFLKQKTIYKLKGEEK